MKATGKLFDTSLEHYEKKEYKEAEKAVDELLGLHPDFQLGRFLKAVILEETGRKKDAEQHYAKSGNRYTLWFRLGGQLEGKDPERAIRYYERVGEYDPRNNQLWFSLGSLYERQGERGKAKDCFGKMQLFREFLSRVAIPLGFLIILVVGGFAMIKHGDKGLGSVVFASAVFCIFWLKRDGGRAVQMLMKKRHYSS